MIASIGGNIQQISASLNGAFNAPLIGLFLLSLFFRLTTPAGAIVGTFAGLICSAWLAIGAIIVEPVYPKLPVSTEFCNLTSTLEDRNVSSMMMTLSKQTMRAIPADELTGFNKFYALSYMWYTTFGILVTMISGLVVSLLSGGLKNEKNRYVHTDVSHFCYYLKQKLTKNDS